MQDEFPDLHHKMSKKIAQLTRVIYHLNTKNDEHESNLRNIIAAYEQEMDDIVDTANSMLQRYKEAIEKNTALEELEKEYKEFKDHVEHEKTQSMLEFNNFKKKLEEKDKLVSKDAETKLASYQAEIDAMKTKFAALQQAIEQISHNNKDLKNAHKKELETYVRQQNEK